MLFLFLSFFSYFVYFYIKNTIHYTLITRSFSSPLYLNHKKHPPTSYSNALHIPGYQEYTCPFDNLLLHRLSIVRNFINIVSNVTKNNSVNIPLKSLDVSLLTSVNFIFLSPHKISPFYVSSFKIR